MDLNFLWTLAERKAVVIEIGTRFTKIGFSGDSEPRHIIHTLFQLHNGQVVNTKTTNNNNNNSNNNILILFIVTNFIKQ
jgi:actin-related protein